MAMPKQKRIFKQSKTFVLKKEETKNPWVLVNADGKTLGRLSTRVADMIRGKDKANYTPHVDNGNFVVIINAAKIVVTGNKMRDKKYYSHSRYAGGLKEITLAQLMAKDPTQVIFRAVEGMLPKNKLASRMITKLKIYSGPEHPHQSQSPKEVKV